jgi:hypothetical protein
MVSRALRRAWAERDMPAAGRAAEALRSVLLHAQRPEPSSSLAGAQPNIGKMVSCNGTVAALVQILESGAQPAVSRALEALRAFVGCGLDACEAVWGSLTVIKAVTRLFWADNLSITDMEFALEITQMCHTYMKHLGELASDDRYDLLGALAMAIKRVYDLLQASGGKQVDVPACVAVVNTACRIASAAADMGEPSLAAQGGFWREFESSGLSQRIAMFVIAPPSSDSGLMNSFFMKDCSKKCLDILELAASGGKGYDDSPDGRERAAASVACCIADAAAAAVPVEREQAEARAADLLRREPFKMGAGAIIALLRTAGVNASLRGKLAENEEIATNMQEAIVGLTAAMQ